MFFFAISLDSRDVRRHPDYDNALLIQLTLSNGAEFDQPYPKLRVSFSDLAGNVIAERLFQPEEYLSETLHGTLFPAKRPLLIELEVIDPGERAISYQFNFY